MKRHLRTSLLLSVLSLSVLLQACSVAMIMQVAGGLLAGLANQIQNPALRQIVQTIAGGLGSNPQNFGQFLQGTAGQLANQVAGQVLPAGAGQALAGIGGTGVPPGFQGPATGLPAAPSAAAQQTLSAIQAQQGGAFPQVDPGAIQLAAQRVLSNIPDPPRTQMVQVVAAEVTRMLQQIASNPGARPPTGGTPPFVPTIPTAPGGAPPAPPPPPPAGGQNGPPIIANPGQQPGGPPIIAPPPPPLPPLPPVQRPGGINISFDFGLGPINIGGTVNLPLGGRR
jgi:hypothetical protein